MAEFVEQHGRLPRQRGSKTQPLLEGEQQLGLWSRYQRLRRHGKGNGTELTPEEAAKLEELPGWGWDPQDEAWEQQQRAVADFVEQHGRLPREAGSKGRPLTEGERPLGKWCRMQRQRWRGAGTYAELTPEEAAKLEALPGWWWGEPRDNVWEQHRRAAVETFEQHGRLPRHEGSKAQPLVKGERLLGLWCHTQRLRQQGEGAGAQLTKEQAAKLEALLGWRRRKQRHEAWEQQQQAVAAFAEQHGRLPRQRGSKAKLLGEGEQQLGRWCDTQRRRWRGHRGRAELTVGEREKLEAIPGWKWGKPRAARGDNAKNPA